MSSLDQFRDRCARMAAAEHKPECPSLPKNHPYWPAWHGIYGEDGQIQALGWNGPPPKPPTCAGCMTATDRALFAQMAGEIDDYLAPQTDLFGEETTEPRAEHGEQR